MDQILRGIIKALNPPLATVVAAGIAATGVLLTAIVTLLVASRRLKEALQEAYDKELRTHRIESYSKLWALLDPFARYPRPEDLTYSRLNDISLELRDWYFREGGLFLSEATREAYFALQDFLKSILDKHANPSLFALAELKKNGRPLAIMLARREKLKKEDKKRVAKYLHEQLSFNTRIALRQYSFRVKLSHRLPNLALRRDFIDVLNRQLAEIAFYRKLRGECQNGEKRNGDEPVGPALVRKNRSLLEKMCEDEITPEEPEDSAEVLDAKRSADIVAIASTLRTTLTEDVLTRKKPAIG